MDVRLPDRLRPDWAVLTRPTEHPEVFNPLMTAHLPAPAARWLAHAIEPGTPLLRRVMLRQHGALRLGGWRRFTAIQALSPLEGFVWAATTSLYGLPVRGFDRYREDAAQMRHRLFGVVPLASASGPDLGRSAAARQLSEMVWVPAVALSPEVDWKPVDAARATAVTRCDGYVHEVTITVRPDGELQSVTIPRWHRTGGGPWREELFAAVFHGESNFGGYTVPVHASAGWGYGTSRWSHGGVFIRQVIDWAVYR
jgi:Family of unknown function (DUF6544)